MVTFRNTWMRGYKTFCSVAEGEVSGDVGVRVEFVVWAS